jgi:hypothetical protein
LLAPSALAYDRKQHLAHYSLPKRRSWRCHQHFGNSKFAAFQVGFLIVVIHEHHGFEPGSVKVFKKVAETYH